MPAQDEVRVLRDAHKLGLVGTDYVTTEDWELPIVEKLEAAGVLELSAAGRILQTRSYRVAPAHAGLAKECYDAFEADRLVLLTEVAARLQGLAGSSPKSGP